MNGLKQLENVTSESLVQVKLVEDTAKTYKIVDEAVEDLLNEQ
jgi:hypothetical protein